MVVSAILRVAQLFYNLSRSSIASIFTVRSLWQLSGTKGAVESLKEYSNIPNNTSKVYKSIKNTAAHYLVCSIHRCCTLIIHNIKTSDSIGCAATLV